MGGVEISQPERGVIVNRKRAQQIVNFSGLRYGTITATDVDALMEFGNKLFVWVEFKLEGVGMPTGQKLAFQRASMAINRSGIPSYVLLAEHNTPVHIDIPAAECQVISVFRSRDWEPRTDRMTVKEFVDNLCLHHLGEIPGGDSIAKIAA